jgi:hypothetical protein
LPRQFRVNVIIPEVKTKENNTERLRAQSNFSKFQFEIFVEEKHNPEKENISSGDMHTQMKTEEEDKLEKVDERCYSGSPYLDKPPLPSGKTRRLKGKSKQPTYKHL